MSSPFPFLSNTGVFNGSLVPTVPFEISTDDIIQSPSPSVIELKYGLLSVISLIAPLYGVSMPCLKRLLCPSAFQSKLEEIVHFYGDEAVSVVDAYNYLRLHAVGGLNGDMKAWTTGLQKGTFFSCDGTVLGKCFIISGLETKLKNAEKGERYWKRPWFMTELNREFKAFQTAVAKANPDYLNLDLNEFAQEGALTLQLVKACQLYIVIQSYQLLSGFLCPSNYKYHITARGIEDQSRTMLPSEWAPKLAIVDCQLREMFSDNSLSLVLPGWLQRVEPISGKGLLQYFKRA